MKIVFQHDQPLPVLAYGGTERIIYWLMKELVKLGHHVVLIGHPHSRVQDIGVELIPTTKNWIENLPKDTDCIHLFTNTDLDLPYPLLVTIEGNGRPGETFHQNTVFVSRKHAQNHRCDHFVYNGIDLDEYPYPNGKKLHWDHFLFLAKASWKVKNLKSCVRVCKEKKKNLHIAGGRTFLPSSYIYSYGLVENNQKKKLLTKCDALLFPVRWHEPFGIAIIEAMAFGLPVIGSPYGSLPELIQEDVGCIVQSEKQLAETLERAPHFSPQKIRSYVENNFSSQSMAKSYLNYYAMVMDGQKLSKNGPCWAIDELSEDLLSF